MSNDDSGSMPSDNDFSRSFSSSTEKSDGVSQTSGVTDTSWNLASTETKKVNRSKVVMMGVMVLAAGMLGLFTFRIVDQEEVDDFQAAVSSK
jgi:hypothetical protein